MAKAKAKKSKNVPRQASKKVAKKAAKKVARKVVKSSAKRASEKAAEVRLPLTAPVRVAPSPRPLSPGQRMPMPIQGDRPIAPVQLRQPSLFQRELPLRNDRT